MTTIVGLDGLTPIDEPQPILPAAPCPFGSGPGYEGLSVEGRHSWEGVGVIQVNIGGHLAQNVIPAIAQSCACGLVRAVAVSNVLHLA